MFLEFRLYLQTDSQQSENKVAQLCPTLCDPTNCRLPGSPVHGIFQARILKWVAISLKVKSESEVAQACLTLCDPVDCSLSGSSIYVIFQARVLEWIAISFSRGSS